MPTRPPRPTARCDPRLLAAKRRIREAEAAQFRLPRFLSGVGEWFDALPADVEDWTELPDAPVELVLVIRRGREESRLLDPNTTSSWRGESASST
jgi:hypothetical protein